MLNSRELIQFKVQVYINVLIVLNVAFTCKNNIKRTASEDQRMSQLRHLWNGIACTKPWTHTYSHCGVNASSLVFHPFQRPPNPAPFRSSLFPSVNLSLFIFYFFLSYVVGPLIFTEIGYPLYPEALLTAGLAEQ